MKNTKLRMTLTSAALLALLLTPSIAAAQEFSDLESNGNLHLRGYGSFFIEGNTHTIDSATASAGGFPGFPIPGGLSMIDQMHVQYLLPQAQKGKRRKMSAAARKRIGSSSVQTECRILSGRRRQRDRQGVP